MSLMRTSSLTMRKGSLWFYHFQTLTHVTISPRLMDYSVPDNRLGYTPVPSQVHSPPSHIHTTSQLHVFFLIPNPRQCGYFTRLIGVRRMEM